VARSADALVARSLGAKLKRAGSTEWAGPCPACGGDDRFSINTNENVFNCRGSEGGDVIKLVEHVTGCSFGEAVERLTGQARRQRKEDEARQKRNEATIAEILKRSVPAEGTHGEAYMHERGLRPPRRQTLDLRFVADLDYWGPQDNGSDRVVLLATLPALIAIIRDSRGAIIGISQTYLDPHEPRKWTPTGSRRNGPKKIRGHKQGGMIRLGAISETLAISEGVENALAWWQMAQGPEDVSLAAAVDLGNLAGRALGTVPHPVLKDANGEPRRIHNGQPDPKAPGIILPDGITSIILLADLDSETYATAGMLRTAGSRFIAQGIKIAIAWPWRPGMRLERHAYQERALR
jgi:hypothetical protein